MPVPRDLRRLDHDEVGLRDTRQQAKHEHIKRSDVQSLEVEAVGSQPSPLTMRARGKHTCKGSWLSAFLSCPEASVTHSMQSIDIFVSHCPILLRTNATHWCVNLDMLRISIRGYTTNHKFPSHCKNEKSMLLNRLHIYRKKEIKGCEVVYFGFY